MPSREESITAWTPEDAASSARPPTDHESTRTPKPTCSASAPTTVRGRTARRSVEHSQAIPISATIPPAPHSTSITTTTSAE